MPAIQCYEGDGTKRYSVDDLTPWAISAKRFATTWYDWIGLQVTNQRLAADVSEWHAMRQLRGYVGRLRDETSWNNLVPVINYFNTGARKAVTTLWDPIDVTMFEANLEHLKDTYKDESP
jgi:hypothetical protein